MNGISKKRNYNFVLLNLSEFPITTISEKAINNAAHIGFNNPEKAIGIAIML